MISHIDSCSNDAGPDVTLLNNSGSSVLNLLVLLDRQHRATLQQSIAVVRVAVACVKSGGAE